MTSSSKQSSRRGTALLAVLWLTAALSAIAFSVADTVRSEIERSIANQESTRAYYLARGGVERVLFQLRNIETSPGSDPAERFANRRRLYFQEPVGDTLVEMISERGKLPLRTMSPQLLNTLLIIFGESPASAASIVEQAFSAKPILLSSGLDNSGQPQTFRPSITSMENVEELLLVPGITPEILYGRYGRLPDGSLVNRGGLIDCFTPYLKESTTLDPFSVHPSLLIALGMQPAAALNFTEARRRSFDPSTFLFSLSSATSSSSVGMRPDLGSVFQVRSTARMRLPNGSLSPTRRTVSLALKFVQPNPRYMWISPWTHLRWYDQAFSDVASSNSVWLTTPPPSESNR
jgi:general secretion pathway protein K